MNNNQSCALPPMTRLEYERKCENGEIPYGAIVRIVEDWEEEFLLMVDRMLWNVGGD